jgi:hypothetical protein
MLPLQIKVTVPQAMNNWEGEPLAPLRKMINGTQFNFSQALPSTMFSIATR